MKFDIYFKFILQKRNCCTLTPSYLGNVCFATVTMVVNSLQPTILCVITFYVFLSSLYDQYVPVLDSVVLFVVIVVVIIFVRHHLLGMDWSVVMSMDTIICFQVRGAGMGGVCGDPWHRRCRRRCHRSGRRRQCDGEPPPSLNYRGEPLEKFSSLPHTTHIVNQGGGGGARAK